MKQFLFAFFTVLSFIPFAQHQPGFVAQEARDLIQICNSFTYLDLEGSDKAIIPKEYTKIYTSPVCGLDNVFQVYKNKSNTKAVIHFRGSTAKKISWLANVYSTMIPAKDTIFKNNIPFVYQCAEDANATIHAGYMLAVSYLQEDLLKQLTALNEQGIYTIFITGHSQGASLAQLMRAYLAFLPSSQVNEKNSFKVYAFANPMVGNKYFAQEYKHRFADPGFSFLVHNPDDFVIKMPISYNDTTFLISNIQSLMGDSKNFNMKDGLKDGLMNMFGGKISQFANGFSANVQTELMKDLGDFRIPTGSGESNFEHTSTPILLPPTVYPLELKDPSILEDKELMKTLKRDENGEFEDKSLYKSPKATLQHKPYNYYTALLKVYFPSDYNKLKQKYFVMPQK